MPPVHLSSRSAALLGLELPVFSELHLKMAFEDRLGVINREPPLVIWEDAQSLPWWDTGGPGARRGDAHLLAHFPAACTSARGWHGAATLLLLWAYHVHPFTPTYPLYWTLSSPKLSYMA